jgi:hypothetical protein
MKVALLLPGYLDSPDYLHMMTFENMLKELGFVVERLDPRVGLKILLHCYAA